MSHSPGNTPCCSDDRDSVLTPCFVLLVLPTPGTLFHPTLRTPCSPHLRRSVLSLSLGLRAPLSKRFRAHHIPGTPYSPHPGLSSHPHPRCSPHPCTSFNPSLVPYFSSAANLLPGETSWRLFTSRSRQCASDPYLPKHGVPGQDQHGVPGMGEHGAQRWVKTETREGVSTGPGVKVQGWGENLPMGVRT